MTHRLIFALALASICLDAPSSPAAAQSSLAAFGRSGSGSGSPVDSLERVLAALEDRERVSFIYDPRIVRGRLVSQIEPGGSFVESLRQSLSAEGLDVQQVGARTYVIAALHSSGSSKNVTPAAVEVGDRNGIGVETLIVTASMATPGRLTGEPTLFDLDADDLAILNATSTDDLVYELPSSTASVSAASTALFGALSGVNLTDLRGFGVNRSVVLVNGRRRTLTLGGNGLIAGVDLNSIAEPFIERLEVSPYPGGARYDSAAGAGVLNFVLPRNLRGVDVEFRGGVTERGDALRGSLSVIGGVDVAPDANLTYGLHFQTQDGLKGADREVTATPYGFSIDGRAGFGPGAEFLPGFGGSSATPQGLISGGVSSDGVFARLPGGFRFVPTASGGERFVGELNQLFNGAADLTTLPANERAIGYLNFTADLSDDVELFGETHVGLSNTEIQLAAVPGTRAQGVDPLIGDAVAIPIDNGTIPSAIRDLVISLLGPDVQSIVLERRYVELGPRQQTIHRRTLDTTIGVKRSFGDDYQLSASYRFGRNGADYTETNRGDRTRLSASLDEAACRADPACVPVNFFDPAGVSQAAADFIRAPTSRRDLVFVEQEAKIEFSAAFVDGDEKIAGLNASGGALRSSFSDEDRNLSGVAPIGSFAPVDSSGDLTIFDFAFDLSANPVRDHPLLGDLSGGLSVRATASSTFSTALNFEAGAVWRPIEQFSLFARGHLGERPPSVIELFYADPRIERSFVDPCASPTMLRVENVARNCFGGGAFGVPTGFTQASALATYGDYGNSRLRPESIESYVLGGAFDIDLGDLFSAMTGRISGSASWQDINIRDSIESFANPLLACYSSPDFSSPACADNAIAGRPAISRDPVTRQITHVDQTLFNLGGLQWRGVDLEARLLIEPRDGPVGRFSFSAFHTLVERFELISEGNDITRLDGLAADPRNRTLIAASVEIGDVKLSAAGSRRGRAVSADFDVPEARIPPVTTFDLSAERRIGDRALIRFSVQNVTDVDAPIVPFVDTGGNTYKEYYDIIGRRFDLTIGLSF